MIAVFAALDRELADLRRRQSFQGQSSSFAPSQTWATPNVLLVRTGIGWEQARAAASVVLDRYHVQAALVIGLAGALDPHLAAGDLLVAQGVTLAEAPSGESATGALAAESRLVRLAEEAASAADVAFRRGDLLTSPAMLATREEKEATALRYRADAVDMESFGVALAARDRRVPFVAVRAIVDGLDQRVPRLPLSAANNMLAAVGWLAYHPGEWPASVRLAKSAWRAQRNLTKVAHALLARLSAGALVTAP